MLSDTTHLPSATSGSASTDDLCLQAYEDLRRLARSLMAQERLDHTLQATALVNEVYVRLAAGGGIDFQHRHQFYATAAEAMRHVLVDHARRKTRRKRGGRMDRQALAAEMGPVNPTRLDEILDIDHALADLEKTLEPAARVVKLRYFAGFTNREAAAILGVSPRRADQLWAYARAWLLDRFDEEASGISGR